jgi:hypothetical protein
LLITLLQKFNPLYTPFASTQTLSKALLRTKSSQHAGSLSRKWIVIVAVSWSPPRAIHAGPVFSVTEVAQHTVARLLVDVVLVAGLICGAILVMSETLGGEEKTALLHRETGFLSKNNKVHETMAFMQGQRSCPGTQIHKPNNMGYKTSE